ncbi:ABC transporter substrate-binding protein [Microbacterium sp. NPDC058062]|uniref:ABC transporter substrate-binding protein n=1 Tax=Microbacterium sp. NPDC058062 TaxID=3346320 RepID=UPI0036DF2A0E
MITHRRVIARSMGLVALIAAGSLLVSGCTRGGTPAASESSGEIATSPGFDGETISLGLITVTSGPIAPVSAPLIAAQQAWAKWVNANGGIEGYKVELNITDSGYNPAQAIQQYERTKGDVAMYANIFGTPIALTLMEQLQTDDILALVGTGEGSLLRAPNAILAFTPYQSQIIEGVATGMSELDTDDPTVCGAGLEGPLTENTQAALEFAEDELGYTLGPVVSVSQTSTDATPQILQLQAAECDLVAIQGVPAVTTGLLSAAAKLGWEPQWTTSVTGWEAIFEDNPIYDYAQKNLFITADVVPFGYESAEGMSALVEAHDEYTPDVAPTAPYVSGWTQMLAVQSVLEEAIKRGDLSHAGLVEASSALSTFDLQGIGAAWGWGEPADRTPPTTFNVYRPDASVESGLGLVEADVPAPDAAVNYPY